MNKKGFTLVEVIVVIALLGLVLIITSTSILGGSARAKEKMLQTKIENIEKAAVIYGQDKRNLINIYVDGKDSSGNYLTGTELATYKNKYELCYKEGNDIPVSNCYYYLHSDNGNSDPYDDITTITVGLLANPDGNTSTSDGYINYDEGSDIVNPVDEDMTLNDCQIQIYQKYGKIYAHYTKQKKDDAQENTKCWVD